ncbi:helix-turn-helix domain-containing protein [Kribbella sp. NBC_00709]|uniref:IclR family transcriptional regulator n=1 Tax=Kribbella sp. NBC_00709 TaxID=2975972 RepID=UPI002E2BAFA3|nr:helix-turn-helix domain-containing protein [Kribbella sp. NBC_00709]
MPTDEEASTNTSVENAFAVLNLFSGGTEALALSDIARLLGLPLSTAHRIVTTLCDAEFLSQQHAGGLYVTGLRVRELLNALYNRYPIRRRAARTLRELAGTTGQAAALYVPFGAHCLRIAGAQDRQQIHRPLLIGEALSLRSTPCGLVLLAYAGSDDPAPEHQRELAEIRRTGHLSTTTDGLRSVVFPLLDAEDRAFAVIAVEGSTLEFKEPTRTKVNSWGGIVRRLQDQCREHPDWTMTPFAGIDSTHLQLRESHAQDMEGAS